MEDVDIQVYEIFIEEVLREDPLTWLQCYARYYHGLHLVEIAERSHLSSEAVRRRICKIIDRVKERVDHENPRD